MGFLDKLWDETLAGPAPDTGLGKLHKYDSLSATRSPPFIPDDQLPVTRTITILRTTSSTLAQLSPDSASTSESPTTPGTPRTPVTPVTPGTAAKDFKKLTRRKSSADAFDRAEPRSLTGW